GKIGIRDAVLMKNGPFTPEEREEMNKHPAKTLSILKKFHFPKRLEQVPLVATYHHEKIDGSGYSERLAGSEIPFGSRILAVADVFDALTSRRDYPKYTKDAILGHNPMPLAKAVTIMKEGAGSHFDQEVINAFLSCLPKILTLYRGTHFPPEYVDEMIASLQAG
ncbi:MAG TPA: HD domain-containing protein, partial [Deltaproteobacteria bacterium]|nr:HD domain-containing protein [Deltaproteobacteria bacterium]